MPDKLSKAEQEERDRENKLDLGDVGGVILDGIKDKLDGTAIGDAIEGSEIVDKIETLFDSLSDYVKKGVTAYRQEASNAKSIQKNSLGFATPFKTQKYIIDSKLAQLAITETWLDADNLGGGSSASGAYSGQYSGTNQEIVWQFFTGAGFSKESTAGIMGNIEWESGFIVDKIEAATGRGYGLIQWTAGRRDAIEAAAASEGKDINDINFQLDYALKELESGSYWMATDVYSFSPYNYPYQEFKRTNDVKFATEAFCWMFERPAEVTAKMDKRLEAANKYYNEFKNADFSSGGLYTGDASGLAAAILRECKNYEGRGYTQNTNPSAGPTRYGPTHYDCSSLVQEIYKKVVGIDVGATTHVQVKYTGGTIIDDVNQRRPGDLLYYGSRSYTTHVAISCGGDEIFHAANESLGVMYQKITTMPDFIMRIKELQ